VGDGLDPRQHQPSPAHEIKLPLLSSRNGCRSRVVVERQFALPSVTEPLSAGAMIVLSSVMWMLPVPAAVAV